MTDDAELAAQVERDYREADEAERTAERFSVTRAQLIAGMIVGIGGEDEAVPTQAQVERAADLIIRAACRD